MAWRALAAFVLGIGSFPTPAADWELQNVGVRARVDDKTVLGDDQLITFEQYDVFATLRLPWQVRQLSERDLEMRLLASVGLLRGADQNAFVASAIPVLAFDSPDARFTADLGGGLVYLSRRQFDIQNYGGPVQVALTLGASVRLSSRIALGYRYLHYSDAGAYGSDTLGADFHMVELIYRY